MCVLIFSTNLSETLLILRINERDMVINVRRSLCKVSFNSSQNLKKLAFSRQILKNTQSSNLMEIRPVRAELFRAGGRTERQSDRQTDSQTDRQAGSQPAREPASQAASQPARQTNCRFLQFVLFCPVARLTLRHDSSSCTDVGNKPKIERQRWINKQLWIAKKRLFYNFGIWLTVVLCKDQRAIWRIR